jgi:hypothetical protein
LKKRNQKDVLEVLFSPHEVHESSSRHFAREYDGQHPLQNTSSQEMQTFIQGAGVVDVLGHAETKHDHVRFEG